MKGLKVGVEKTDAAGGNAELSLEPAQREMTIQDLLRHTSGLTYGVFGKSLVKQKYNDANLFDANQTLAEFTSKLAKLPLAHQPGTMWDYSMSTDVLGRVVEVVSGMPFDQFVAERITKPLGMSSTGFYVTGEDIGRIAEPQIDPETQKRPAVIDVTKRPNWLSGGGGMVSTAADYMRFTQMLLNGGVLDGTRLLSPKTVAFMTSDHLPPTSPTAARRCSFSSRRPWRRRRETDKASDLVSRCAPNPARTRARVRSANSIGAASTAPISGSTRRRS